MPDQDVGRQEERKAAPQPDPAAGAPQTGAAPETEETTDELTPEERAREVLREYQQARRQRIEDAKAMIRTRGAYHRARRMGQTYTYTVQPGDTLATVAKIFYARPERWPEIYEANAAKIPGPAEAHPQPLEPGTELVIP